MAGGCRLQRRPHAGLPEANQTTDQKICDIADREQCVLITKDTDFVDSHLLRRRPPKLLLIPTGNISNADLEALMTPLLPDIIRELGPHTFLELGRSGLVVRG